MRKVRDALRRASGALRDCARHRAGGVFPGHPVGTASCDCANAGSALGLRRTHSAPIGSGNIGRFPGSLPFQSAIHAVHEVDLFRFLALTVWFASGREV